MSINKDGSRPEDDVPAAVSKGGDASKQDDVPEQSDTFSDAVGHLFPSTVNGSDGSVDTSQPDAGTQSVDGFFADGYRLVRRLGAGGMGTVYEAVCATSKERRAIKFLGLYDPNSRKRFEKEVSSLGRLDHPNIVSCLDHDHSGSQPFLVMPLVEGDDLTHFISGHYFNSGQRLSSTTEKYATARQEEIWQRSRSGLVRLTESIALELMVQLTKAIAYAHQSEVLHRDIKPSNLRVALEEETVCLKVIDFGISRQQDATTLTAEGGVVGTYLYASPEQVSKGRNETEAASDVYAIGCVMHQCVTGQLPFHKLSEAELRSQKYDGTIDCLSPRSCDVSVSDSFDQIVRNATFADTRIRYQSANDLLQDLERAQRGESVLQPSRLKRIVSNAHKYQKSIASLAAGIAAVSVLVGAMLMFASAKLKQEQANRLDICVERLDELEHKEFRGDPALLGARGMSIQKVVSRIAMFDEEQLSAQMRSELAEVCWRCGEICLSTNDMHSAVAVLERADLHYRAAKTDGAKMTAEFNPENHIRGLLKLSQAHLNLDGFEGEARHAAERAFETANAIGIATENASRNRIDRLVADCLRQITSVEFESYTRPDAAQACQRWLEFCADLKQRTQSPEDEVRFARALGMRAKIRHKSLDEGFGEQDVENDLNESRRVLESVLVQTRHGSALSGIASDALAQILNDLGMRLISASSLGRYRSEKHLAESEAWRVVGEWQLSEDAFDRAIEWMELASEKHERAIEAETANTQFWRDEVANEPLEIESQRALACALWNLADGHFEASEYEASIDARSDCVQLYHQLVQIQGADSVFRIGFEVNAVRLIDSLLTRTNREGRIELARQWFDELMAYSEKPELSEPRNMRQRYMTAVMYGFAGTDEELSHADDSEAEHYLHRAIECWRRVQQDAAFKPLVRFAKQSEDAVSIMEKIDPEWDEPIKIIATAGN